MIFFLFFIVFMPFPTLLLGLYGAHASVVIFYAAVIATSSFLLYLIWHHVVRQDDLLRQPLEADFIEYFSLRNLIQVGVFVASIGIALVNPLIAMFSWGSLFIHARTMKRNAISKSWGRARMSFSVCQARQF